MSAVEQVAVAIVGGGPSGLTAAANLAQAVDGPVLVLERERHTGGIPRHSDHPGFGIRDLHRFVSGPAYARRLTEAAVVAGAVLETEAQVTGWDGERRLLVTSPRGRRIVEAGAVVLATGARERPRPARRIPGDRPEGVYTTGQLQNLVHLHYASVGTKAVVVGAELVSWSAVMTLREAGCSTVAMLTPYARSEAYRAFVGVGKAVLRTPVLARHRLVHINGRARVESVVVENLDTGLRSTIACDAVVTTGDWIPDHELARIAGLSMDPGTLGPVVDGSLRTSRSGVFAIGNLVHPVDTADVAALDGRHVVSSVVEYLGGGATSAESQISVCAGEPFAWVSPQRMAPGEPTARGHILLWASDFNDRPVVQAWQRDKLIGERRALRSVAPGRVFRVPRSLVDGAVVGDGPVTITLA